MSTTLKKMAADQDNPHVKKKDIFPVDPNLLVEEEGFNIRDLSSPAAQASIEGFKESYFHGLYVPPLVVYVNDEGQVVIIEGHKRRRGALLAIKAGANVAFVDCVSFRGSASERVALMLRSGEGQPFAPLEIAFGMLRLHRWGHSHAEIGKVSGGKTASNVEQLLLLAMANNDVHELVRSGAVPAYTAIDVIRTHGEKAGEVLRGHLEVAKVNGKAKVTKSVIHGWAPPRKIVTGLVSSVETFTSALDGQTRHQLAKFEKMDIELVKGKKVEVEASALLELMRVHNEVSEARQRHDTSAAARAQAKNQNSFPL